MEVQNSSSDELPICHITRQRERRAAAELEPNCELAREGPRALAELAGDAALPSPVHCSCAAAAPLSSRTSPPRRAPAHAHRGTRGPPLSFSSGARSRPPSLRGRWTQPGAPRGHAKRVPAVGRRRAWRGSWCLASHAETRARSCMRVEWERGTGAGMIGLPTMHEPRWQPSHSPGSALSARWV